MDLFPALGSRYNVWLYCGFLLQITTVIVVQLIKLCHEMAKSKGLESLILQCNLCGVIVNFSAHAHSMIIVIILLQMHAL